MIFKKYIFLVPNRLEYNKRREKTVINQQLIIFKSVYFLCCCMRFAIAGWRTELQHNLMTCAIVIAQKDKA